MSVAIDTERVSVIIPSRARPNRLWDTISSLIDTSPFVEIVLVLDPADHHRDRVLDCASLVVWLENHKELNTAELWNEGARECTGDYLVTGADDIVFQPGWVEAALAKLEEAGGTGIIALNEDDQTLGSLATHFLASRDYLTRRMGGVLFPPVYEHGYTDVEITWKAAADQRLFFAKDARIDHRHPVWGKGKRDAIYEKGEESRERDRIIFETRRAAGFPVTWEPVLSPGTRELSGWGRVFVANRMGKYPEPLFVKSLLRLGMRGLRPGDVMMDDWPVAEPHHVAANKIVAHFLKSSDCDSLLLLDDDMSFPPNALSVLRDNEDNWSYDAVMGFCTFRTPPPHAVVYRLADEQPGLPESLHGEEYNALANLPESGIVDVDAVGMAFTLIKRHVFEAMLSEYGPDYTVWFDFGKHSEMEDIRFSRKCRESGYRMCVDTSVKVGHVGRYVYGWQDHRQFVKQLENDYG